MARLVVIYPTPTDIPEFDKHYAEKHIDLVHAMPGLKKFELSKGPVFSPAGASGVHLIATLHFDSMADLQACLASPEGQAAAADAQTLPVQGTQMILFESHEA